MNRILGVAACGLWMVSAAAADTLNVDKTRSRIQVDGKSTGHGFTGTLQDYTVEVSGTRPQLAPKAFKLGWKFSDLKTEDKKRDKNMIKWLGGGDPQGAFKFTRAWEKEGVKFAQGELTIHGVKKVISFPYTVKREGDWVTIDGTATLDYQDFKLPLIRALAVMTVDPKLAVRFHIVGRL
ncbi:MAG: YceI family protein [Verrucomicrobiales bacterium]|nr:YceI family protein [Verrucomicrobiota bacterium JB025]